MTEKVLLVDDEPNVLQAHQRSLRALRDHLTVYTAESGASALDLLGSQGPYAVVVSDMRMPEMDGVALLTEFKKRAPQTVRMMLTGNADQQTPVAAINEGDVFRFLNKPCAPREFAQAILAGINHHRLLKAEKDLLEKTLHGSVHVLTEVLSLVNPEAFGRSTRVHRYMRDIATVLGCDDLWQLETTALLSQIGSVILPEDVLHKIYVNERLTAEEEQLYEQCPLLAADLLAKIPRMEETARAIQYQAKNFDGSGIPRDAVKGKDIPLGARLLRAVLEFDKLDAAGRSRTEVLAALEQNAHWFDPDVLAALVRIANENEPVEGQVIAIAELADSMLLDEDIVSEKGLLIAARGQVLTRTIRERLNTLQKRDVIPDRVRVLRLESTVTGTC